MNGLEHTFPLIKNSHILIGAIGFKERIHSQQLLPNCFPHSLLDIHTPFHLLIKRLTNSSTSFLHVKLIGTCNIYVNTNTSNSPSMQNEFVLRKAPFFRVISLM